MPGTSQACCLWLGCASPGPYADDDALFGHLERTHGVPDPTAGSFACRWAGCTHTGAARTSRMQHLAHHTRRADAYRGSPSHALASTEDECRCEWTDCDAGMFADVPSLRAHIEDKHLLSLARGKRCGWAGCAHMFAAGGGNYRAHLWAHLPAWYKPFACTSCEKSYKTASGLARHRCSDDIDNPRPAKRRKVGARQVAESDSESDEGTVVESGSRSNTDRDHTITTPAAAAPTLGASQRTLDDPLIAQDADLRRAGRTALVCMDLGDEDDWEFCS